MGDDSQDVSVKTRPDYLMPSGRDSIAALQGFLHVMGFDPKGVDGVLGANTKNAYNDARAQMGFLPELTENVTDQSLHGVFQAIDRALQEDVALQRQYVIGVNAEENVTNLQAALVAGGSWANRHLGDRISEAEMIAVDGRKGELTERGVRNAATLTGVAVFQSMLNLLTDAGLKPNGIFDDATNDALHAYAADKSIDLTDHAQDNFDAVVGYINANEGDALRVRIAAVLNGDDNGSTPDAGTLDAQIVMNDFARRAGSDIRTAPDSLQTDRRITPEMSHTRTIIAPEVGVDLNADGAALIADVEGAEIICQAYLERMYQVTRNDVMADVRDVIDQQGANPDYPSAVLAYSDKMNGYLLVVRDEGGAESMVYQVSDRNVHRIIDGVEGGAIAMDLSAQKAIAEKIHGNRFDTAAYSTQDIRNAFVENATRFTRDTKESLLSASVESADGTRIVFGLDDLHDGLDKMDSKRDWAGFDNAIEIRDFVKELRQAAEDAREERPVSVPVWQHGGLDDTNSVELDIGGEKARVPDYIYFGVAAKMQVSERGFSFASDDSKAATRIHDYNHLDTGERSAFTDIHLSGRFDEALLAVEPLDVVDAPATDVDQVAPDVEIATADIDTTVEANIFTGTAPPVARI